MESMDTLRIALCGKIRSGKDSVADYLCRNHGFQKFRFGDGIRRVCHILYNVAMNKAKTGKPRALLQGIGQALRQYDPDVWLNYCLYEIANYEIAHYEITNYGNRIPDAKVVISDLRQPNEFERVRREGWFTVRVSAPDELRIERARAAGDNFTLDDLNHETERHVDGFPVDLEIVNDGTIERLFAKTEIALFLAKTTQGAGGSDLWV